MREVRIKAQPGSRIVLVFLLGRQLPSWVTLTTDLPSSTALPRAPPWTSHLQGENGGFSVFPEAPRCRFPFGTCGVSLPGPCCETETKGASPSCTLPPRPCLGTAHQRSLGPGSNPEHCWRRRRRKSGHLPSPDRFPLQCPPVVAAHSPTSQCTWGSLLWGPTHPETHSEDRQRPGWVSSYPGPAIILEACPPHSLPDHGHS